VGGTCHYIDRQELAKIITLDHQSVSLLSEHEQVISLNKGLFHRNNITKSNTLKTNDFYQLNIREHTSGGCSPYSVMSVEKVSFPGVNLTPDDGIIYGSGFALAELKNCLFSSDDQNKKCTRLLASYQQNEKGKSVTMFSPRSGHVCSAKTVKGLFSQLENIAPLKQESLSLVCFDHFNGKEKKTGQEYPSLIKQKKNKLTVFKTL
jgi:hypothetical protein